MEEKKIFAGRMYFQRNYGVQFLGTLLYHGIFF